MTDLATIRRLCLAFPDVQEVQHNNAPSFRTKKRIFCTTRPDAGTINIKLEPMEQQSFCLAGKKSIAAVEGGWGRMGWTTVQLKTVKKEVLREALTTAWYAAAPPKIQAEYRRSQGLGG